MDYASISSRSKKHQATDEGETPDANCQSKSTNFNKANSRHGNRTQTRGTMQTESQIDIDLEHRAVNPITAKKGNPRTLKIS